VTLIVSSFTDGLLFSLQVAFTSTTHKSMPLNNQGKTNCVNNGWDFTFSENHWSPLDTTKGFVHKILLPYLHPQIEQLGSSQHQKVIWLPNC
jgi:hypothetical protein